MTNLILLLFVAVKQIQKASPLPKHTHTQSSVGRVFSPENWKKTPIFSKKCHKLNELIAGCGRLFAKCPECGDVTKEGAAIGTLNEESFGGSIVPSDGHY